MPLRAATEEPESHYRVLMEDRLHTFTGEHTDTKKISPLLSALNMNCIYILISSEVKVGNLE